MNPEHLLYHGLMGLVWLMAVAAGGSFICVLLLSTMGKPEWRYLAYVYEVPLFLLYLDFLMSQPFGLEPDNVWYWSLLVVSPTLAVAPLILEAKGIASLFPRVRKRRHRPLLTLLGITVLSAIFFGLAYYGGQSMAASMLRMKEQIMSDSPSSSETANSQPHTDRSPKPEGLPNG